MSFVLVSPETVAAVATDLKRIGASLAHENASAAASTTAVVSAAADEVSTAVAALFSQHAQGCSLAWDDYSIGSGRDPYLAVLGRLVE
ncbi:PE family protein [Mycobacterium tuberculosis 02_1987]|nr:PE family protein [Mycobacterium tuberculosis 02_1987]